MLGFNKCILPFQHEDYSLPFNVAGLDTIKYDNNSFKAKAIAALDHAILKTAQPRVTAPVSPDVGSYLLLHGGIVSSVEAPGDRAIFQLGAVCNFNLLIDFTGNRYMYFGNFPTLPPSVIAWRVKKLIEILDERITGVEFRVESGIVTTAQRDLLLGLRKTLENWILVNNAEYREMVLNLLAEPVGARSTTTGPWSLRARTSSVSHTRQFRTYPYVSESTNTWSSWRPSAVAGLSRSGPLQND